MPHIDESVIIPAPPQEVWDHLLDPALLPGYDATIVTAEFGGDWPAIGSRFKVKRKVMGRVFDSTAEVTESDRPTKLGIKSVEGNVDFTGTYTLTVEEAKRTRLEFRLDAASDLGGPRGRVLDAMTTLVYARQMRAMLAAVAEDLTEGPNLYYEEKGDGAPILLIPPAGATASTWGAVANELAEVGRVIVYDRRGYARSGGEPVRSIAKHTADAAALLDRLGVTSVMAVGTSVGATIAIDLARLRPDLVRAVVAHDSPWHVTMQPPSPSDVIALSKAGWLTARRRYPEAAETLLRFAYSYRDGGSAWDRFPEEWRQTALENARSTLADFRIAMGLYPAAKELADIRTPVICTSGTRSARKFATATRKLSRVIPDAVFQQIDGAGHAAPFDAPTSFVKVVSDAITD